MKRQDWPERLAEFLEERRGAIFEWGRHDCCLFVCDAIRAMTDLDVGYRFRGRYTTESGALDAMLDEYGMEHLGELVELVCREFGFPEIPPKRAQRGDVILVNAPLASDSMFSSCLGIVAPGGRAAVASPRGFVLFPVGRFLRAWEVV